jgi:adenylate cyclase
MALAQVSLYFYFGIRDSDGRVAAERALSINPSIAEAYAVEAKILAEEGRLQDANQAIERALKLDPDSWEVNREAGRIALDQRSIGDAARYYEKAVSIFEWDFHSWALLVQCYQAQGNRDGVLRGAEMMHSQADKVLAEDPSNGAALGICAGGHAISGNRERAMETIERALLIDPENDNMRYNFACILAGYLKEVEAALELLEPVLTRAKSTLIRTAMTDTDLDPLRGNPRFERMLVEAQDRVSRSITE